jgi:ribosomal protein S1
MALPLGEKAKVKVARIEKRGIIIRFESGERGIVSSTRCSDDASLTDEDIAQKFKIGSSHECRVLQYSSLDNMYIASFQP